MENQIGTDEKGVLPRPEWVRGSGELIFCFSLLMVLCCAAMMAATFQYGAWFWFSINTISFFVNIHTAKSMARDLAELDAEGGY